jgi:hypothetical protein
MSKETLFWLINAAVYKALAAFVSLQARESVASYAFAKAVVLTTVLFDSPLWHNAN